MPRISLSTLRAAIDDPEQGQRLLERYFNIAGSQHNAFCFRSAPRSSAVFPRLGPLSLAPAMFGASDMAGTIEHWLRRQRYRRQLKRGRPRLIAEGDSWFAHPLLKDVVDQLHPDYAVYSVSHPGDDLEDMVSDLAELRKAIRREEPPFLIFSGGGNDIIGQRFQQWLKPRSGAEPADRHIRWSRYAAHVDELMGRYRQILDVAFAATPQLQVIFHGYDYAVPVPYQQPHHPRVAGLHRLPWLSAALDGEGVTDEAERKLIIVRLVDLVNERLAELPRYYPRARHLDLRGTLNRDTPEQDWDDELHPNNRGFARVAAKFVDALSNWSG